MWKILALVITLALGAGCRPKPAFPFTAEVPAPTTFDVGTDGRGRFREVYTAVRDERGADLPDDRPVEVAIHLTSNEPPGTGEPVNLGMAQTPMRVLFIPGLFGECVADTLSPFPYGRPHIEQFGYTTDIIMVAGRSSSEYNGTQIRDYLLTLDIDPDERVVLVGYSKGAIDAMLAVAEHPEAAERVDAVISFCGAVGGSPLADDVEGTMSDLLETFKVPGCPPGDGGAVNSLKRNVRTHWLAENSLPESVKFYSIGAFADRKQISSFLHGNWDKLAVIDPRNDSQVIFSDAVIPGSTLLGYLNVDHWGAALAFSRDMPVVSATALEHTDFPREVLLEAIVRYVEEDLSN